MTAEPTQTEHRSPWVVFTTPADPWPASETAALVNQNGLVLRLDGREMRDPASAFRTFARELSFLGSFGHNWDALVDCLQDHTAPAAFTEKAARGMDVAVALSYGRLLAPLSDVDWPGGDHASF
ncbi:MULTISPECIES: barstar family protein [Streptomyces]|uniref:Barstar (barnase inhibitor) domain-containing protein n=1 Tax=Streptomyces virginiae TaxID=1961 RepID=A0ABQ3NRV8_STRVG|nr:MULTISPECIES: barstar family protein [Streptomyces]MBP2348305.1 chaperone required for assembly of F1-ATPase [Streptomyces virginiae]RST15710.1 hypothetical protein EF904_02965 [Streptomyces sp. WAC05950]GGQ38590.1 hypothetical protein GCM10010215_72810 [Streptomyces virginiae]GHI15520.1 hypothetical protein Scinn_49830 [Streptomyces virginiae]